MRIITYDCEVFKYDWIVVFKDHSTGKYYVFHNDNKALLNFLSEKVIYIGFNTKHYDQYIIKGICANFTPKELKRLNDYLINGFPGWQYPDLQGFFLKFNNVDIRDDMYNALSLKAIEGHIGINIKESEIDFNIDRPLTHEELKKTIHYCKHDVDSTERIIALRNEYLKTKLNLGKRANIDEIKALSSTNAKLTALMLGAKRVERTDGRNYIYPSNLDLSVIPKEVIDFFEAIHDESIPDKELFKTSLEIEIGGMPCKYAWGGVHGSQLCYFEERNGNRIIQNRDVSSLYPSLIEQYNYLSRNVSNPKIFYNIKKDRIAAKHNGDMQLAKDLKLPLNTVSGAQENKYNDLYDPLPTRSLRISGQLFLTILLMRLIKACKTFKPLNFNTDGLMYSIDKKELSIVDKICTDWEKETRFELETDNIQKVWIKDVNNLLFINTDGHIKKVGSYLNYGISSKGQWAINNSAIVVKKATIEYLANGVPVEETIANNNDIFDYQIIAKAGSKYSRAYQLIDGKEVPTQKVNRVYATSSKNLGKLYKVKEENSSIAKIENLPDHCIIDNDNQLTIKDVDKTYYIDLATKRVNDFLGIKPERKMKMAAKKVETSKELNVYQKLIKARNEFLNTYITQSGKNINLEFKYFELSDIVPSITRIFNSIGLIAIANFTNDTATLNIINTDKSDEPIEFTAPFTQVEPIISNTGKQVTNNMQALGSSITYMRRYLYLIAMDICVNDDIEPTITKETNIKVSTSNANKKPKTTEEREKIKEDLTNTDGNATPLQIKGLKTKLKELKDKCPDKEEWIAKIALRTESFTKITKAECEKLIKHTNKLLKGDKNEEN